MTRRQNAPSRAKPRRLEDAVHIPILTWLRSNVRGLVWHTPNGGIRHALEGVRLKNLGTTSGVPDILILANGKLYGLEVKEPNGAISDRQTYFGAEMSANGGSWACVRSKDEAIRQVADWNLPRIDLVAAARRGMAA